MMIVVPYTHIVDEVFDALDDSGFEYSVCDVSGADDNYWKLLCWLWKQQEDFIVVEQDIVVNKWVLESLETCLQPWCAASYPYFGGQVLYAGMGCARFRKELITAVPDLMEVDGAKPFNNSAQHPAKHWCTMDAIIQMALARRCRLAPHRHGEVGHVGDQWPSHGCIVKGPAGGPVVNRNFKH